MTENREQGAGMSAVVTGVAVVLVTPLVLWAALWVALRAAEEHEG
mgnify:CR=1 FL=1